MLTSDHREVSEMFKQFEALGDAKVKVLSELIKHQVKEEEREMFPKAKKAGLDLVALGQQMALRKDELIATM